MAPNSAPSAIDADTSTGSQRMCPWTSNAAIPVYCIAAMPPPTMAPPIEALAGKLGATATAKPTPVRTIAATSESDVNAAL
jgi:hypothetical protein